ncbi:hypothetical protein CALCODRAFT_280892 [Calocera cornea HHB12733]|uniref:Uncharacterized protein n=1 Tax=Calocera cornea HHB12733 TaxID=1353952 RepID=A0A165G0D7_9BASI|nr:hypothetical protein CALCODRAFT_280892 [Calocera cornea HHB12733]
MAALAASKPIRSRLPTALLTCPFEVGVNSRREGDPSRRGISCARHAATLRGAEARPWIRGPLGCQVCLCVCPGRRLGNVCAAQVLVVPWPAADVLAGRCRPLTAPASAQHPARPPTQPATHPARVWRPRPTIDVSKPFALRPRVSCSPPHEPPTTEPRVLTDPTRTLIPPLLSCPVLVLPCPSALLPSFLPSLFF